MIPRFEGDGIEEERTPEEEAAFSEGVEARKKGSYIDTNPFVKSFGEFKSWIYGWTDQDMIELHE